jgi:exo-beta-1,3-glucanase (GH17 family)
MNFASWTRCVAARICCGLCLLALAYVEAVAEPPVGFTERVTNLRWIAYSPTHSDPNRGIAPLLESLKADLSALRKAQFTGLVTYSCAGPLGEPLIALAQEVGFQGMIVGVWDIASKKELTAAQKVSGSPIVLGYCMGNEGYPGRYDLEKLTGAMQKLREATGKPVSTSEEFHDYSADELMQLGDWVFPNVHPFFQNEIEPTRAVDWTLEAYRDLERRTKKFVWFKEVGLPTAGDKNNRLSEQGQQAYYFALAKTEVRFVYFEAFDQTWKTHLPVEPHWGIFRADRTPKLLATSLMSQTVAANSAKPPEATRSNPPLEPPPVDAFYVYCDSRSPSNHFTPSGYMGDCGDIELQDDCPTGVHAGASCIKVVYRAIGKGPHTGDYPPPCKWAGVCWQKPANNWGTDKEYEGQGYDLSAYRRMVFWARSDKKCKVEFKVGGIRGPYGDSLKIARTRIMTLGKDWKEITIDLKGADLKHVIGGFGWTANWEANPKGATIYLDDIRYEK